MTQLVMVDDYIDNDVAYLLGLIFVRGRFHEVSDVRRLIIDFPYRILKASPLPTSKKEIDVETQLRLCLDDVRSRINELLEVNVDISRKRHNVTLQAIFTKNTMSWRNLRLLCGNRRDYRTFIIPDFFHDLPDDILREFIRGIADASASPRNADRDRAGKQRIVLQIQHDNWMLPVQLCQMLQRKLKIPVDHILWGHPNMRAPKGGSNWSKEHRIRLYADNFAKVGFNFSFKQQILEDMVEFNNKLGSASNDKFCNPMTKKNIRIKNNHLDEKSTKLPNKVRNKHFDSYFQICRAIGCKQGDVAIKKIK